MSQITTFGSGGGGGGTVITLTGNTGGLVGPDISGNIDIVGTGNITVAGNAGTHTETISFTGILPIANGGTDASSFSVVDGTVYYDGTRLVTTATGSNGQVLTSGGPGVAPSYKNATGGGITTIDGDTGSATGSTITFDAVTQAGSSVAFSASGATVSLNTTDSNFNTIIGKGAGNVSISGTGNVCLGYNSGNNLSSGIGNCFLGDGAGENTLTGSYSIYIGNNAGSAIYGAESSNIYINNRTGSVLPESNTLRIGNGTGTGTQELSKAYICGINNVDLSTATLVTESADQLGTTVLTAGTNITITPGAGTLTIAASGGGSPVVFNAFLNASVSNVTGNGAGYYIPFNGTTVNTGGGFNTGTGIFTVPNTGVYSFNTNLYIQSLTNPLFTIGYSQFDINSGAADYIFLDTNFFNMADGNGNLVSNGSLILPLTAGDTVRVFFSVIGGGMTVGLAGAASASQTSFSGYQVA